MRRLALVALLATASACSVFWEKGSGGGGDDVCAQEDTDAPTIAPAPLRNPDNLTCESFGGGCNTECGPCPAVTAHATPPLPSWGVCGSLCDSLGDGACTMNPECRTVKDAGCTIGPQICLTDFLGCFPTDTARDDTVNCFTADAWACSRSKKCEAHHGQQGPCPAGGGECPRPFATCVPVGVSPGSCDGVVTCRRAAPPCPAGTTPGVANGCYTDACIVTTQCPKPA